MARTAVTHTVLAKDASTLQATGVAADPANGHVVASMPIAGTLLLDIDSTFAGVKTWTIRAGAFQGAALGDLVLSLNAQRVVVPISGYRFAQIDGTVNIDIAAGATGTIRAYRLPY